jgi:hypothetical protein
MLRKERMGRTKNGKTYRTPYARTPFSQIGEKRRIVIGGTRRRGCAASELSCGDTIVV